MDRIVIVVFNTEREAYEGTRALDALHAEGSITVYARAVVAKDSSGKISVKQDSDPGPLGTAVGMVTGMLVGVPMGPVGMAAGAAAGTLVGAQYDLAEAGVGFMFIDEASTHLQPGKAAVVAEIQEEWITPLDTRMEAIGGTVLRRGWSDVVDAQIARDVAAIEADIAAMEDEYERTSEADKARLQARVDAAKTELRRIQERASKRIEAAHREAEAKMAALDKQVATARTEQKEQIERRKAEVDADYKERTAKLDEARELRTQAAKLTMEAVAP